jgi:hypothetical protein
LGLGRTTWGNTCAEVVHVGELSGKPPYYGNPAVRADVYDLTTGELRERNAKIPVPGTFKTWRQIDPPPWASTHAP